MKQDHLIKHAILLPACQPNVLRAILSMRPDQTDVPVLQDNQVLIKLFGAGCNPSDIAFIRGGYTIKKSMPTVPGFEGAGKVIATGKLASSLLNKKVSCFTQEDEDGTWANYLVTKASNCIPLKDHMPVDQAIGFAVNPFTAYGLIEKARQNHSKAIVQNAAGSQIGKFIRVMASTHSIEVINIVRKKEHVKEFRDQGIRHVLCPTSDNFREELTQLSHQLEATTAFDAVGGELSGVMLNALPERTEFIVYGGLSDKPIAGLGILEIIFKNKRISGFDLRKYIREVGPVMFSEISEKLQDMFISGTLATQIQGIYKLADFVNGLKAYLGNMSGGKVIFKP